MEKGRVSRRSTPGRKRRAKRFQGVGHHDERKMMAALVRGGVGAGHQFAGLVRVTICEHPGCDLPLILQGLCFGGRQLLVHLVSLVRHQHRCFHDSGEVERKVNILGKDGQSAGGKRCGSQLLPSARAALRAALADC